MSHLGNDTYYIDSYDFRIDEAYNGGTDTVRSSIDFNLGGKNLENMVLTGTEATEAFGNGRDNRICGNRIDNEILGRDGDDTLTGWNGNDTVSGGSGDDLFRFKTAPNETWNVDRITDFRSGSDTLGIDNKVFAGLGAEGALGASRFHAGDAAHDSSDRIVYDRDSGNLYFDADGSGSGDAILFAQLGAGTALSVSDIFVI